MLRSMVFRARLTSLAVGLSLGFAFSAASSAADGPPAACGGGRYLAGIDVSSYQGEVDWKQVKRAGIVFAFARVSDGLEVVDARFRENFTAMRRARVRRGAYQYFRASADPKAQADLFLKALRGMGPLDLPPVLDVE